jgi:hypothetical protein
MEQRAIGVLRFCAWLHLFVCIAAAITMLIGGSANPPGIVTGVLLMLAGVTGWAFFLVVCSIAESLIEIRTNTAQPAKSRLFDRDAT